VPEFLQLYVIEINTITKRIIFLYTIKKLRIKKFKEKLEIVRIKKLRIKRKEE